MNLKHFRKNLIYGVYVPIYSYTFSNVFFLAKLISRLKPKTIYGINRINKRVYIIIWKQTEKDIFRLDIIMFFTKIYSFGLSFHRTFWGRKSKISLSTKWTGPRLVTRSGTLWTGPVTSSKTSSTSERSGPTL